MKQIGNIIREYRVAQNLTQEELGKELHVTKQAVSKWETGRTLPDVETLRHLSDVLSIDLSVLLDGSLKGTAKSNRRKNSLIVALSGLLLVLITGLAVVWIQDARPKYVTYDPNVPNPAAINVTIDELLVNPQKYDGRLVRFHAVGGLRHAYNGVYATIEDWEHQTNRSIGVVWGEYSPQYESCWKYNGKHIVVEGIFDADDGGYGNQFRTCIREVNVYDVQYHLFDFEKFTDPYYRLEKHSDGSYTVFLYDAAGEERHALNGFKEEPAVLDMSKTIMVFTQDSCTYYDGETGRKTRTYTDLVWFDPRYVAYAEEKNGQYYLICQDVFGTGEYYQEILLEGAISKDGKVIAFSEQQKKDRVLVRYYAGKEETTIELPIPVWQYED